MNISVTAVVDRGFKSQAESLFAEDDLKIKAIFAGKYRRYHSKSFAWHILHLPTLIKNIRDVLYLCIGLIQSLLTLVLRRPQVVFCKGGFVCVPIGIVARLLRIPLVIHDSDTRPGLTNRILSRWACYIGTGMPVEFYPYDRSITTYTGIPVSSAFRPVASAEQQRHKAKLGFGRSQKVLLITGGGNGADSLNKKVVKVVGELLESGWGIVHLAGRGKANTLQRVKDSLDSHIRDNWQIEEFTDMVPRMLAADVVIARTSASTLQECANAKKRVIGIPSPHLEDQSMNADFFASKQAILAVDQTEVTSEQLIDHIRTMSGAKAVRYGTTLHAEFARPQAAQDITDLIMKAVR